MYNCMHVRFECMGGGMGVRVGGIPDNHFNIIYVGSNYEKMWEFFLNNSVRLFTSLYFLFIDKYHTLKGL